MKGELALKNTKTTYIDGEIKTLKEWADEANIGVDTIKARYKKGIRGAALLLAPNDRLIIYSDLKELWGRWVYVGKKPKIKPTVKCRKNSHWVYVGG